ncbi:MAG: gamma-glutamyl-gamma-aminobutyrate hydrolase family protein [Anaerolineaceae bacterium]|nr:gamma-glutamyl-gamma-aminobutyrate hydrolase family protein [Anaerolineaceae bacterium]
MNSPLIGITTGREVTKTQFQLAILSESYIEAVRSAGGTPVMLPPTLSEADAEVYSQRLDGILLTGGPDVDPAVFNGQPHPRVYEVDPARDALEMNLVRISARNKLPFLGICRGIQVINVALGGTLFTDIADQMPDALKHDYYPDIPRTTLPHNVLLIRDSQLTTILGGTDVPVNSLHHQGIDKPAPVLSITGHAPDGLIESVELPGHPFGIGVQWHPEWLQEHESMRELFRAFIRACAEKA